MSRATALPGLTPGWSSAYDVAEQRGTRDAAKDRGV